MNKNNIGLGVVLICLMMSGPSFSALRGKGTNLFPPMNDGKINGVGMIDGDDGNNYVFKTPGDNNGETLTEGSIIYFDLDDKGNISSVSNDSSLSTYQGESAKVEVGSSPDGTVGTFLIITDADGNNADPIVVEYGKQAIIKPAESGGVVIILRNKK